MHPGSSPAPFHGSRITLLFVLAALLLPGALVAETLNLPARSRAETSPGSGEWRPTEKSLHWDAKKTAIVVCDMWDRHWCPSATERVAEMAPRMNEVLKAARAKGVFIIHSPSDTLNFYKDHPARKRAQAAPKVEPKVPLLNWCHLDPDKEAPLPIDDSDEGCDGCATCPPHRAWSRQIAALEIHDEDAITDSAEAYYLMRERGITNVIVMGVHANMCVLGRPFSIRQMRNQGQNVVLMRDLTDAMYNSYAAPYVNHFRGTELVVEHIEQYWCPSITSAAFLGGDPFRFRADQPPKVVFLIGEDEYKTWETLPVFAEKFVGWRGLETQIIQQNPANKHDFPGLNDAMNGADLLVVSVRRRALSKENLALIKKHLERGRPLVGIRTTSHAFAPRGEDAGKGAAWTEFDAAVLGGNYTGHHGNGTDTLVRLPDSGLVHPVLTGVDLDALIGKGSLYKTGPLKDSTQAVLLGAISDQPAEPVAWVNTFGPRRAKVFYTSLGHEGDFAQPNFRRLLLNGILWALSQPIPPDDRLQPR
jgi:nicotinamidase-related amidase/type 1 glutamine amidotransferase